jgi:carbonic anhydrase
MPIDTTMEKLIAGHKKFLKEAFPLRQGQFFLLAEWQRPEVLFVTCADSRVVPDLILQTQPGDLFICRNVGNVIPLPGEPAGGVSATIQYAVEFLRVKEVIVCGHSDCGTIRALMHPGKLAGLDSVKDWLQHVEPAWKHLTEAQRNAGEAALHIALTHANVMVQVENLKAHEYIQRAVAEGRLNVHGWYYDILSGRIEQYDEGSRKFVALKA